MEEAAFMSPQLCDMAVKKEEEIPEVVDQKAIEEAPQRLYDGPQWKMDPPIAPRLFDGRHWKHDPFFPPKLVDGEHRTPRRFGKLPFTFTLWLNSRTPQEMQDIAKELTRKNAERMSK